MKVLKFSFFITVMLVIATLRALERYGEVPLTLINKSDKLLSARITPRNYIGDPGTRCQWDTIKFYNLKPGEKRSEEVPEKCRIISAEIWWGDTNTPPVDKYHKDVEVHARTEGPLTLEITDTKRCETDWSIGEAKA